MGTGAAGVVILPGRRTHNLQGECQLANRFSNPTINGIELNASTLKVTGPSKYAEGASFKMIARGVNTGSVATVMTSALPGCTRDITLFDSITNGSWDMDVEVDDLRFKSRGKGDNSDKNLFVLSGTIQGIYVRPRP